MNGKTLLFFLLVGLIGVALIEGCKRQATGWGSADDTLSPDPTQGLEQPPPPVDSLSQRETQRLINLYTAGESGVYIGLCSLIYDRQLQAIGLVAGRWLELNQDAAAAAVTTGLLNRDFQIKEDGGEYSQATVLHFFLLPRLGEKGWKGLTILDERGSAVERPTLSADDETWLRYLRNDAPSRTPQQGVLWLLVRDPVALAHLQDDVDVTIQDSEQLSGEGWGAENYMRDILLIAPPDGGVTDAKLKE